MLTSRRLIAVGGVVMLAAVFTCAHVLGEPARPGNPSRPGDKAKDSGFLSDDASVSRFADTPLLVYQPKDGDRLFALQVQPALPAGAARPRDLVILVDTTASQAGGHLAAAEKLAEAVVASLGNDDRAAIRTVNVKSLDLSHGLQPARKLDAALETLKKELPMGAADLKAAVNEALKSFDGDKDRRRAIVYLGDGMSVRNPLTEDDKTALADKMVQEHVGFFPVPVGPRLEPTTLHGLASRTGGAPTRLNAKSDNAAVAKGLLDVVSAPVLYGATIELPAEVADHLPAKMPPLRGDAPTLLVGHLKPLDKLSYTLKGTVDGKELTLKSDELKVPAADRDHFFLAGMIQQWQNAKDQPALIRADRALAYALEQTQLAATDLLAQGEFALRESRYDLAAALYGQARDLDPTSAEAQVLADLVGQLRDGKITKEQLQKELDEIRKKREKAVGQVLRDEDFVLTRFEEQDQPGDKPPAVGGDDILAEAKRRERVAEQKAAAMVDDVIRQAMRSVNREPDAARDYLRRTLDAIRNDNGLSAAARERLARRVEASLADAEIRGERVKESMREELARRARVEEEMRRLNQTQAMENRVRERMRVFHNLMNQAREDEAYAQAQDIRQDLINEGQPVPQSVISAYMTGQVGYNLRELRELQRVRQDRWLLTLLGVERSAIPFPDEPPIQFPPTPTWKRLTDLRRGKYESSRLIGQGADKSRKVLDLLNAPVEFKGFDQGTKLDEAMDYLSKSYGIQFDINIDAFRRENIENVGGKELTREIGKMKGVALSTVVRKVLDSTADIGPTKPTWIIRNGSVEITTAYVAAAEKAIVAYPIADLAIPITTQQQLGSVLQPGQLFGITGFGGGFGAIAGGLGGIGGIGGLGGAIAGGLGGLGGAIAGGLGGLGGAAVGLNGLGGGIAGGLGGGLGGGAGGLAGIGGGLGGIGGVQGIGGGGVNIGLGALGGTQAPLLVKMITQLVGDPDEWGPIDPLQLAGVPAQPGGQPDEIDKKPKNQLAFYPPALSLVVRGSSRIQTRPQSPIRKEGDALGADLRRPDPNVRVANFGDDRANKKKKYELSDADPKEIWQDALAKGVENPGLIIACVDFLATMKEWNHSAELLKANIRQGIIVRPWVYEALAQALRETNASADEIERAETSAADLEPLDAQGFLRAARGMENLKNPQAALAFCRQAALLEPGVPGPYREALGYASQAKDTDGLEWAATRLLSRDWPSDNAALHEAAESHIAQLAKLLSGGEKSEAGEKMLARVQQARQRDLEITLVWESGTEPADLDLQVEEPTGSVCVWRNRQTVGGGTLLGGRLGDKKTIYVAAEAFSGGYKVRVERLFGHPLGDKAQLRVVRHKGTPDEREELITVPVPRSPGETVKEPVLVNLEGGRRTNLADVPPPQATERLSPTPKRTESAVTQLQRLAHPLEFGSEGQAHFGMDGLGGLPEEKAPDPGPGDEVVYQTRVSPFVTNRIDASVQATISADRRYVRLNLAPTFNVVTGTRLQPVLFTNPVLPGFFPRNP
jgi:hypothetical protein